MKAWVFQRHLLYFDNPSFDTFKLLMTQGYCFRGNTLLEETDLFLKMCSTQSLTN